MEEVSTATRLRHIGLQLLLVGGVLLLLAWQQRADGHMHIYFLAVPGDAVLIETPHGRFVLIDGGSDPALLALELSERMPFWRRELDGLLLTAGDGGRLPGQLAALQHYSTPFALAPPELPANENSREWRRLLQAQGARLRPLQAGAHMQLDGLRITVPAADSEALAIRIDYGETSVLLYNAAGPDLDAAALATARPVSLLAYPWTRDFNAPLLAALQPQAIVFTEAYHARSAALMTMHERALGGAAVYHPDLDGTIEWISNGRRWSIP
jgi:beta-lactamase superfamily II metal-dependent hydrolase